MMTIQDRDRQLHQAYRNRNFLEFVYGEPYFDRLVRDIHWRWEQSGTWGKVLEEDVTIMVIAFEMDNGYLKEAVQ
jgi:hypothetical protein